MRKDTRPAGLLMTFIACLVFMVFGGTASATSLPPVNTNIVNAPTAQFIGSMVTANNDSIAGKVIRQAVTPLNPQFKDCEACNQWFGNVTNTTQSGLAAKFIGGSAATQMQISWSSTGYVGYVGSCIDSQTGNACLAPQ